jgi:hypothetical protein
VLLATISLGLSSLNTLSTSGDLFLQLLDPLQQLLHVVDSVAQNRSPVHLLKKTHFVSMAATLLID